MSLEAYYESPGLASAQKYSKAFKHSLIAHLSLIAFVIIKSFVFPGKAVPYTPALRVDLVALPDVLKKDLKFIPPTPPAATKEKPKEKEEIIEEKAEEEEAVITTKKKDQRESKIKNALARIKALDKISEDSKTPPAPIIKGNAISKGTSLSGDAKETAMTSYYDLVRNKLQENWQLPVWLARQDFSAKVQIFIDGRGRISRYRFDKVSGNAQFDEAVKKTLKVSQPFPPPTEDIASTVFVDGILVGFPL
jgi:outer membrane biosynthesis protein TonB